MKHAQLHNCTALFHFQNRFLQPKRPDFHLNDIEKGESDIQSTVKPEKSSLKHQEE